MVLLAAVAVVAVVVTVASTGTGRRSRRRRWRRARPIVAPPDAGSSDAATEGRLTFAITKWECGAKDVGSPPAATALGQYCFLSFTVRNEGTSPDQFPGAFQ